MLAIKDETIAKKMRDYTKRLEGIVLDKAKELEEQGYKEYVSKLLQRHMQ